MAPAVSLLYNGQFFFFNKVFILVFRNFLCNAVSFLLCKKNHRKFTTGGKSLVERKVFLAPAVFPNGPSLILK